MEEKDSVGNKIFIVLVVIGLLSVYLYIVDDKMDNVMFNKIKLIYNNMVEPVKVTENISSDTGDMKIDNFKVGGI